MRYIISYSARLPQFRFTGAEDASEALQFARDYVQSGYIVHVADTRVARTYTLDEFMRELGVADLEDAPASGEASTGSASDMQC